MTKFIKTFIYFCVVTLLCMTILIIMLYNFYVPKQYSSDNKIFVWGDSQTYQGINLVRLGDETGCNIYSSSEHGAGVYDFLVFTEQVPDSSICIVGYSQGCLLRSKELDYNRSGVSTRSISTLFINNYSLNEISKILRDNKFMQSNIFHQKFSLFKYSDKIVSSVPINLIKQMYDSEPYYYNDKYSIFSSGIEALYSKGCKIICIGFPFYNDYTWYYRRSTYRKHIDKDITSLAKKYNFGKIDTIYINDTDSLLMHDLTHLNEIGAERATDLLIQYIDTAIFVSSSFRFIILNNWSCN